MFKEFISSLFPSGRGKIITEPTWEKDPNSLTEEEWTMIMLWEWVEYVEEDGNSLFTPTPFCLRPFKYQTIQMPW